MNSSEKFWDKVAEKYAAKPIADETTYQKKLKETQSFLSPEMNVLEFGCGTGTTAIHHAPYVKHIDAIDISEKMLAIGQKRARDAGVENIDFSCGTLADFNGNADSMDIILGLNILHLLPDRRSVLNEVSRVLKPGGLFVSSTACLGASMFRYMKLISPLGKFLGLMPDFYVFTEENLVAELKEVGFEIKSHWNHGHKGMEVFIVARKNEQ